MVAVLMLPLSSPVSKVTLEGWKRAGRKNRREMKAIREKGH